MLKSRISLLFLPLILGSCLSFNRTVSRWPDRSEEQVSRNIPCEKKENIFSGFGWTTPPITSREIEDHFTFAGTEYSFSLENGLLNLQWDHESITLSAEKSSGIYPDLSFLDPVNEIRHHWVPKTYHRMESVPVTKTRTVPVTTTGANGMISTSFRTEFYTDWEFHTVVETRMEWEATSVLTYHFPELEYYDVHLDDGTHFYIYQLAGQNTEKFLLQNPDYYHSVERNKNIWGVNRDMNLLFIDSNANGIYMEPEDHLLFHVWNPYDPDSQYSSVDRLIDNHWYPMVLMHENRFLDFTFDQDMLKIAYLNEEYMGNEALGVLTFTGLDELDAAIFLNGKRYRPIGSYEFPIEYGYYNLLIRLNEHMDFNESFLINAENPDYEIVYKPTEEACTLIIRNLFSESFSVTVTSDGYEDTFFNREILPLPLGDTTVEINVSGYTMVRSFHYDEPQEVSLNFEEEVKKDVPPIGE